MLVSLRRSLFNKQQAIIFSGFIKSYEFLFFKDDTEEQ